MNSIGWIVAHLAWQEQRYFLTRAQDVTPVPLLNEVAPNGGPPTTPSLRGMLTAWRCRHRFGRSVARYADHVPALGRPGWDGATAHRRATPSNG